MAVIELYCFQKKLAWFLSSALAGYSWRSSLSISEIEKIVAIVKHQNPNTICFVDNCYGEFVDDCEPTAVGADLMAGSLIKNPGGRSSLRAVTWLGGLI